MQIDAFLLNQIDSEVTKWNLIGVIKRLLIKSEGFEEGLASIIFYKDLFWAAIPGIKVAKLKKKKKNTHGGQKAREGGGESQKFMQCKKKEASGVRKAEY